MGCSTCVSLSQPDVQKRDRSPWAPQRMAASVVEILVDRVNTLDTSNAFIAEHVRIRSDIYMFDFYCETLLHTSAHMSHVRGLYLAADQSEFRVLRMRVWCTVLYMQLPCAFLAHLICSCLGLNCLSVPLLYFLGIHIYFYLGSSL